VSTTNSIGEKILGPNLRALDEACGGAGLDIRCSDALSDLDDGIDVAIRFGPGGWRGLQSRQLGNEVLFPVASPGHDPVPANQAELCDNILIHHPESGWRLWLDPSEVDPTQSGKAVHVDSSVMVLEAAASGVGIGLARGRLAARDLQSGRLVRLLERSAPAEYSYWAVWSASSPKLALIASFVEAVEQLFKGEFSSTDA
jgi:DNA-binding transcriptional LysR family regulator